MALKKISKYIYSLLLLLSGTGIYAQKLEWKGVLIGADLSRFIVPLIDTTRYCWEFSGEYEITNNLFLVAEIGSETTNLNTSLYDYKLAGGYTRLGADYNFMKHIDDKSEDKMFVGLRYGFTTFYHEAENIQIRDEYWGNFTGGIIKQNWLAANWIEVVAGMRTHLFNNFYLGWSAKMRIKLGVGKDPVMAPYTIPGYGKPWNNTAIGFNYSLYYLLSI